MQDQSKLASSQLAQSNIFQQNPINQQPAKPMMMQSEIIKPVEKPIVNQPVYDHSMHEEEKKGEPIQVNNLDG